MPTINQLSAVSTVSAGDQFPIYSPNNGDARRASMSLIASYLEDTMELPATQVSFTPTGTSAQVTTVQAKLRETVSVNDYGGNLATAVTSIGASSVTLVINQPVTISNDLTIPENITLKFENSGLITISSGKRLYINGGIEADRLHQCFSAGLLSNVVTASVSGNALTVSAVSANTIEPGQVVNGGGLPTGTLLFQQYGTTGVGTYALSGYRGFISSTSMTITGSQVIFGAGTVEEVYPQWFGAVADGVADCTVAFQLAVYSQRWGGKLKIPAGSYLISSPIVLHPGINIEGDVSANVSSGSPPPTQVGSPTYLCANADNIALFVIAERCNYINIRNINFTTKIPPYLSAGDFAPYGTQRKAIVYDGHAPQGIFGGSIENCQFFGFYQAILANDTWAPGGDGYAPSGYYWSGSLVNATDIAQGTAYQIAVVGTTNWAAITGTVLSGTIGTVGCRFLPNATAPTGTGTAYSMPVYYDWGINPLQIRSCQFIGNSYGVLFNTNNADSWRILDCVFILPPNSSGVHLNRCGYLKLDSCFAFAGSLTNTEFVNIVGVGAEALDAVTLDNCQAENCSHFVIYPAGTTNTTPPAIHVQRCIHQISADVYLGSPCEYNSYCNQIMSQIYVDSTGVRVNSINDEYMFQNYVSGPTWGVVVVSGDANSIFTYIPGRYASSTVSGPKINGVFSFGGSGAGTPVGAVTPAVVGQEYLDTATSKWYKSIGLTAANWVALN